MITSIRQLSVCNRSLRVPCIRGLQTLSQKGEETLFLKELDEDEPLRNKIAYSMSFASDEGVFNKILAKEHSESMKEQLRISHNQLRYSGESKLPRNMIDVLEERDQAIVVTESSQPFNIVHVNSAWEGLCGWSLEESRGKSLSMLQGNETDPLAVTSLVNFLLQGQEAGTVLTNYTKEGRRFRNHLRVGTMDEGLFVGVLKEINDGQ